MVTAMQKIPLGYNKTDIGIIPDDWDVKELRGVARFENGKAHEGFISDYGEYIVINSKFISSEGDVVKYSPKNFSPADAGDIALVMSDIPNGKALAKCYLIKQSNRFAINQRICSLRADGVENAFLFYKLNRNSYFLQFDNGVSQTNLKKEDVLSCPLSIPRSREERTTIVSALDDIERLADSLEKLIAKKRAIKQGAIQELLTGKRRLPRFNGMWIVKAIGELFRVTRGQVLSMTRISSIKIGEYQYPVYSSQTKENGLAGYFTDYLFENCITWTTDGANAGEVKYRTGKFYCTNVCGVLENKEGYSNPCIAAIFNSVSKRYVSYVGNPKLMNNVVKEIGLAIPNTIEEQKAISDVLLDMDKEIELMEQKLAKYKMLKQGMMHVLLTGKVRLI